MNDRTAAPARKVRGSIRKAKRQEMRRQKMAKLTAAHKPHKLSVELGTGKTIGESVVSVIELNVKPLTEGREPDGVEGVDPTMPDVKVIDSGSEGEGVTGVDVPHGVVSIQPKPVNHEASLESKVVGKRDKPLTKR